MRETYLELEEEVLVGPNPDNTKYSRISSIPDTPIMFFDLIREPAVVMACLTTLIMVMSQTFANSVLNPMLVYTYELPAEESSKVYSVNTIGFFCGAPVAWALRKYQVIRRRAVIYIGFTTITASFIVRTGDLGLISEDPTIAWTIVG